MAHATQLHSALHHLSGAEVQPLVEGIASPVCTRRLHICDNTDKVPAALAQWSLVQRSATMARYTAHYMMDMYDEAHVADESECESVLDEDPDFPLHVSVRV